MSTRHPALRFVLLFAAGIILAVYISLPVGLLFSYAVVLIIFSVLLSLILKRQILAAVLLQCSIVTSGFLLQTIQQSDFRSLELDPSTSDEPIILFGHVISEPVQKEWKISFVLCADSIIRKNKVETDSRRVMITLRPLKLEKYAGEIELGKKFELHGTIETFPFQRNPGEFDYGEYLRLNDIQGIVTVKGLRNVRDVRLNDGNIFQAWIYSAQHILYGAIDSLHSPRHASFLKGIIYGYRADIPSDIKRSFIDTGTIHILAVSGSNVAFVAFILFSVLCFFRLPRYTTGVITVLGLIVYMLITGSSASVVRATIMAAVFLFGTLMERKADIYNSISVAALILLILDTNTLFDVGFQLSFAAVISIVYIYPRLELIIKKIPERFEKIKTIDFLLKLFAVSLAAQLGTIPFTAYYFGRVSVVSFIANIPVVPLSGLCTFVGFAEVFFSSISQWIAGLYAAVNDVLVWFLLWFVEQAADVPFAYLESWNFTLILIIVYYMFLFGVFNLNKPHVRTLLLILVLLFGNYLLYANILEHSHSKISVSIIDVRQGDAILVEFPGGKRMMIDAGPKSKLYDTGERIIVPFLRRKGITTIDYLLITHPHNDHFGGSLSVIKSIRVDTLITSSESWKNNQIDTLLRTSRVKNIGIKTAQMGDQIKIDKYTRVYILAPDSNRTEYDNQDYSSVAVKIIYGKSSMLFVGDQDVLAEEKMILQFDNFLASDIIKIGHHGSRTSTSEEFLNEVRPKKAVISVGMHNQFRHPSPSTINRLKSRSIEIKRTDESGAIVLESDGNRWKEIEWRKRP